MFDDLTRLPGELVEDGWWPRVHHHRRPKKWKLIGANDRDQILGEQADAVRASILSEPVKVQVVESDGNTQTFVVSPKRYKVANAIFNACVAELLLDKPSQPAAR